MSGRGHRSYPQIRQWAWCWASAPLQSAGVYPATEAHPELSHLCVRQAGVVHRRQLSELGVSSGFAAAQIAARRWTAIGQKVVLLQNSPPTREQLIWVAVLDAESLVSLGSHTALDLAGFVGFAKEAADIHLIVPRGAKVTPLPGVRLHESRRLEPEAIVVRSGLPCTGVERSAIDAAAWQPHP